MGESQPRIEQYVKVQLLFLLFLFFSSFVFFSFSKKIFTMHRIAMLLFIFVQVFNRSCAQNGSDCVDRDETNCPWLTREWFRLNGNNDCGARLKSKCCASCEKGPEGVDDCIDGPICESWANDEKNGGLEKLCQKKYFKDDCCVSCQNAGKNAS